MKIEKKSTYTLIIQENKSYTEFLSEFVQKHTNYTKNHLIILLSEKLNINEKDILLFLEYVEVHRDNNTTFIVVYPNVDVDEFPDSLNVVPTLKEAEDVLDMENIQRDLGF